MFMFPQQNLARKELIQIFAWLLCHFVAVIVLDSGWEQKQKFD